MKKISTLALSLILALKLSAAGAIMFDFGPTEVTSTTAKNSPLHSILPDTGDTWNKVEKTSVGSGLRYADGSKAKGISISMGKSAHLSTLSFKPAATPTSSAPLGAGTNTGVFFGPSIGKDAVFNDPGSPAAAVSGLPVGTYDIYIVGYNTNKPPSSSVAMQFWAISASGTKDMNISSYIAKPQASSANNVASAWVEDGNYVKLRVTLTKDKNTLVVFTKGRGEGPDQRGFLNALQIVPVE